MIAEPHVQAVSKGIWSFQAGRGIVLVLITLVALNLRQRMPSLQTDDA